MLTEIMFIVIGLFAIVCTITKPNFYWNSAKAIRMRKIVGDTVASILYIGIGVALIIFAILRIMNVI